MGCKGIKTKYEFEDFAVLESNLFRYYLLFN